MVINVIFLDIYLEMWYNKVSTSVQPNHERTTDMKATGIVRHVDELGRIVIPKEMRRNMEILCNDPLEIYVEDDKIILRKYIPNCMFCDSTTSLCDVKGRRICKKCLDEIKSVEA